MCLSAQLLLGVVPVLQGEVQLQALPYMTVPLLRECLAGQCFLGQDSA